jgi:hypothetical protein
MQVVVSGWSVFQNDVQLIDVDVPLSTAKNS